MPMVFQTFFKNPATFFDFKEFVIFIKKNFGKKKSFEAPKKNFNQSKLGSAEFSAESHENIGGTAGFGRIESWPNGAAHFKKCKQLFEYQP
jgi:hypothetical protein